jgi:3'-5' exoribonuclease
MKRAYVNELAEGMRADAPFAIRSKELRVARNGDTYLALDLADRTGTVAAVCFRPGQSALDAPVGTVVEIRGMVTTFRGAKRVRVDSIEPAGQWDPEDIVAGGQRSADELRAEFGQLLRSVADPELARVLKAVFSNRAFFERFSRCPGSQSYHHAHLGGLIEHTVAVAGLCQHLAAQYPQADAGMLVTAALLHDIGKCDELAFDTAIEYSDEGRLLGHVALGARRLRDSVNQARVRVRPERLMLLEHAVLSHHGELEWGSPKRPSTLEALLLHHADNLDAKASGFSALLASPVRVGETWTDAGNLFRRPLWAPRAVEDDRQAAVVEDIPFGRRSA